MPGHPTFLGSRVPFWTLFAIGAAFLFAAVWFSGRPSKVDLALAMAMLGVLLISTLALFVRRVRVEPGGVVVEYILWQRSYAFANIADVGLMQVQHQLQVQLKLARDRAPKSAVLGTLATDAETVAAEVRSAWIAGRELPPPEPTPASIDNKMAYAVAAAVPQLALMAAMIVFAIAPVQIEDKDTFDTTLVVNSIDASRDSHGQISVWLRAADDRTLTPPGPVDFPYQAFADTLARDAATPFEVIADRISWNTPAMSTMTKLQHTSIYAIKRGSDVFLSLDESKRAFARDRKLWIGFATVPALTLVLLMFGIFRRGEL